MERRKTLVIQHLFIGADFDFVPLKIVSRFGSLLTNNVIEADLAWFWFPEFQKLEQDWTFRLVRKLDLELMYHAWARWFFYVVAYQDGTSSVICEWLFYFKKPYIMRVQRRSQMYMKRTVEHQEKFKQKCAAEQPMWARYYIRSINLCM